MSQSSELPEALLWISRRATRPPTPLDLANVTRSHQSLFNRYPFSAFFLAKVICHVASCLSPVWELNVGLDIDQFLRWIRVGNSSFLVYFDVISTSAQLYPLEWTGSRHHEAGCNGNTNTHILDLWV